MMKDHLKVGLDLKYWRGQHHWPQQDSRPGLVQLFVRAVEFEEVDDNEDEEADEVDEHGWRCDAGKHKPSPRNKGWRWHLSPGQHGNHQSGLVEYLIRCCLSFDLGANVRTFLLWFVSFL